MNQDNEVQFSLVQHTCSKAQFHFVLQNVADVQHATAQP